LVRCDGRQVSQFVNPHLAARELPLKFQALPFSAHRNMNGRAGPCLFDPLPKVATGFDSIDGNHLIVGFQPGSFGVASWTHSNNRRWPIELLHGIETWVGKDEVRGYNVKTD
jgi:hypothetical protein